VGQRLIDLSSTIDTDESNPASRFLLHLLMAAAEFERELIRERSMAGQKRYRAQYEAGKVGKARELGIGEGTGGFCGTEVL
jgi:DNA invertase Pin-like site-specific DNA recombinase